MTTGEIIKTALKKKNKTIQWLAEETGIPVGTLYNLTKKGGASKTDSANMKLIAAALGDEFIDALQPDKVLCSELSKRFDGIIEEFLCSNVANRNQLVRQQMNAVINSSLDHLAEELDLLFPMWKRLSSAEYMMYLKEAENAAAGSPEEDEKE